MEAIKQEQQATSLTQAQDLKLQKEQKAKEIQQQKQRKPKVTKITKFALLSPYLNYYEVMPSKPGKDFISRTLIDSLKHLISQSDKDPKQSIEPPQKRFKGQNEISAADIKLLSKQKLLLIGLNQVFKQLSAIIKNHSNSNEMQNQEDINIIEQQSIKSYIVFIINDQETIEINKNLVGFCRQFNVQHYILPKFLKKNCCEIFGVNKLTSFAIKIEDKNVKQRITDELKEFDNDPLMKQDVTELKYADETIFKTCYVKKWQVEINPKKNK
eukprot:403336394